MGVGFLIQTIVWCVPIWLCWQCGKDGWKKNSYTTNHMDFNMRSIAIPVQIFFLVGFMQLSQRNFGCMSGNGCINTLFAMIFSLVRLALFFWVLFGMIPQVLYILYLVWNFNETNWWKDDDEAFLRNVSYFNAVVCWFFYFFWWFCGLYGAILMIVFMVPATRKSCCSCSEFWEKICRFIAGTNEVRSSNWEVPNRPNKEF